MAFLQGNLTLQSDINIIKEKLQSEVARRNKTSNPSNASNYLTQEGTNKLTVNTLSNFTQGNNILKSAIQSLITQINNINADIWTFLPEVRNDSIYQIDENSQNITVGEKLSVKKISDLNAIIDFFEEFSNEQNPTTLITEWHQTISNERDKISTQFSGCRGYCRGLCTSCLGAATGGGGGTGCSDCTGSSTSSSGGGCPGDCTGSGCQGACTQACGGTCTQTCGFQCAAGSH